MSQSEILVILPDDPARAIFIEDIARRTSCNPGNISSTMWALKKKHMADFREEQTGRRRRMWWRTE